MNDPVHIPAKPKENNALHARAVVFERPKSLCLADVNLTAPGADDVVVDVDYSGISTGTERLLWTGNMPPFPGLSYPLVPGYETVGTIVDAGADSKQRIGESVFVSGANCYGDDVRGLFGGSASRVVVKSDKALRLPDSLGQQGTLLALAATALHTMNVNAETTPPDLIVGHGVLGRLLARVAMARGADAPTVWELDAKRRDGATGYCVMHPDDDPRRDYRAIYDVSGDANIVDSIVDRLAPSGEVVLAGFYDRVSFAFPAAFMREMRLRIAAEWKPEDLLEVQSLIASEKLVLDGLITHIVPATEAENAYDTAFGDPMCLKMVMDWRELR
ncbi:MAG: chlorophyll synthesis pathway protein BchC [Gammaproteobacteria bacterium]